MGVFEISGKDFMYDGKPVRILSGAIHYFRVVPEYWEDRLRKLRLAVSTLWRLMWHGTFMSQNRSVLF